MGSSPGFGSAACDGAHPASQTAAQPARRTIALFGLAVARAASLAQELSPPPQHGHSPAHSSRGTPSGRPPRPAPASRQAPPPVGQTPSDCVWAAGFRFSFTPLAGVLFTGPSRYWSTIGRLSGYVALERGRPRFPQGSSCPVVLTHPTHQPARRFGYGALTPSGRPSQAVRLPPSSPGGVPCRTPSGTVQPQTHIGRQDH